MLPDIAICRELASALRAGDDSAAAGLAARAGIPRWLLTHPELGPRGQLDVGDAGAALGCISMLTTGRAATLVPWLAKPAVIDLVAEAVETAAVPGTTAGHPWELGIAALEGSGHPAIPMLLRARAEEGSGRPDQARQLIGSCLLADPDLLPAIRDAMEYELCAGNWARAWELASSIGSDGIAEPLLRPLDRLRQPAPGAERASRNQPCPCGSGRKYKACCRVRDLDGGVHPLPHRAPALYAMLATYAWRGPNREVTDRMATCAIGAPYAAMLALDLAIFDGGTARRFLAVRGHLLRDDERDLLREWLAEPVDMYEVSSVKRGSELSLRSLVGGPQRVGQRDRMFSLSVRRLDIVIARLLPDGARPDGGGRHLQALGGMAILPRDLREAAAALFPGGPVAPGSAPLIGERLLSQFAGQSSPVFQTADGDEYRWCETTIEVGSAGKIWPLLTRSCLDPPRPPIMDMDGYYAYLKSLPGRFWTRNTPDEIEYAGEIQPGRAHQPRDYPPRSDGFHGEREFRATSRRPGGGRAGGSVGCGVPGRRGATQRADRGRADWHATGRRGWAGQPRGRVPTARHRGRASARATQAHRGGVLPADRARAGRCSRARSTVSSDICRYWNPATRPA